MGRNTDSSLKTYNYTYDALNRIKTATDNTTKFNLTGLSYDKNGNIMGLIRAGQVIENPNLALGAGYGTMDNLAYAYDSGNKLTKVTDNANDTYGFKDGINTGNDFTYDANGNMLSDANKAITNITYNHLNLPTTVTFSGTNKKIDYFYDAVGTKLKKVVTDASSLITTEYAGNYVYEGGVLQFFSTSEGYVEPKGTGWEYVYQYKDHLGNIRLSYADSNGDGVITPTELGVEIREENNFYPGGLKHKGYNSVINGIDHPYGFNGKEENNELGIGTLDFGARNYDPALMRWMNVDLLSEAYLDISPYVYAANNPIFFVDPDGLSIGLGNIFKKNKKGEFVNQELAEAFTLFAQSDVGKEFLSLFAEAGQEFELTDGSTLSFDEDGEFHKEGFDLNFKADNINDSVSNDSMVQGKEGADANTSNPFYPTAINRKNGFIGRIGITLNTQLNENNEFAKRFKDNPKNPEARLLFILSRTMALFHEIIIHALSQAQDISDNCEVDCSNFSKILYFPEQSVTFEQHQQARQTGSLFLKRTTPAVQKIFKNAGIPKTAEEIKKLLLNFRN